MHERRISTIESVVRSHEDRVRLLEYKSIDLEARSRRNNILFYGLRENRLENCKDIICEFTSDRLNVNVYEQDISRAHRVGRFDRRRDRPIIVAFESYCMTDSIIKQGHLLKDTEYGISRDFPLEITRARRTLWPEYKQQKAKDPSARVAIVFPAKLLVNGTVVRDLFPEWDHLLKGSRIDMTHASQQSVNRNISAGPSEASQLNKQSTPVVSHTVAKEVNNDNAIQMPSTEGTVPMPHTTTRPNTEQTSNVNVPVNSHTVTTKPRDNELNQTATKAPARRKLTPSRGPVNRPSRSLSRARAPARSASLQITNRANQRSGDQAAENQPPGNQSSDEQSAALTGSSN